MLRTLAPLLIALTAGGTAFCFVALYLDITTGPLIPPPAPTVIATTTTTGN